MIEPMTVRAWLEGANKDQCDWLVRYVRKKLRLIPFASMPGLPGHWDLSLSKDYCVWMFCGGGEQFEAQDANLVTFSPDIRTHAEFLFSKARNAWNQRLLRARRAEREQQSVFVDASTKKGLQLLARENGMSEQELMALVIEMMLERRSVISGLKQQRKLAKKAILELDLGLVSMKESSEISKPSSGSSE